MKHKLKLSTIEYIYGDNSKIQERKQAALKLVEFGYNPTSENIKIYIIRENIF